MGNVALTIQFEYFIAARQKNNNKTKGHWSVSKASTGLTQSAQYCISIKNENQDYDRIVENARLSRC